MFARLSETSIKLLRLDKQQEMFKTRIAEILYRSLKSLTELEEAKEKERLEIEA